MSIVTQHLTSGNRCCAVPLRLAPNVHVVSGDYDEQSLLPETKVVQIGQFRIGLAHGHQVVPWGDQAALAMLQRQLDCDILVSGHTHKNEVRIYGCVLVQYICVSCTQLCCTSKNCASNSSTPIVHSGK
jgi:predicted phosphodiesterase